MNDLKYIVTLLMLWIATVSYSQSIQRGRVVEQNSGSKPLPGVQIDVKDATPKVSDRNGEFQLEFSDKRKGQMLFVNSISKLDYLIINQKVIDQWSLSVETDLKVVMCQKIRFEQSIKEYYKIGYSRYKERYETILQQLKAERAKEALNDNEYNAALDSTKNEYKKELSSLDYYSDIFARINKDDLSGVDSIAMSLLDRNQLDSAIIVYERARYYEKLSRQLKATKELIVEMKSMIPSLRNYADMCAFAGGKENYLKVGKVLEAIAMSDTTDYNYTLDYLKYLQQQKQYKKGVIWGERAMKMKLSDDMQNSILTILSECYMSTFELHKAAEINKKLKKNIETFEIDDRIARNWFDQVLAIVAILSEYETLTDENIASVMANKYMKFLDSTKEIKGYIAKMDVDLNELFKGAYLNLFPLMISENKVKEVMYYNNILSDLYKVMNHQSQLFIKEETRLLGEVIAAELEFVSGNKEMAKVQYESFYNRFNKLYKSNPESFAHSYLSYLYHITKCFYGLKLSDRALETANEAFNLIEAIDLNHSLNISVIYINLISITRNIYEERNMLEEQEQGYIKMLKVYDMYRKKDTRFNEIIMSDLCSTVLNLADVEVKLSKLSEAAAILKTTLAETSERKENELSFLQQYLLNVKLADVYAQSKNDSAIIYYKAVLPISDKLVVINKNQNTVHKIGALYRLGNYYRDNLQDYSSALKHLEEGLKLSSEVNSQESIFYIADGESYIGNTYELLGNTEVSKEHFQRSLDYNIQGLAIREKSLGNKHPDVIKLYAVIGYILNINLKDYPNALAYYLQVLPMIKDVYGDKGADMADLCFIIGDIYLVQQKYNEALEYYTKSLNIGVPLFGHDHFATANLYRKIAEVYYNQGNYTTALENLNKVVAIREKIFGKEDASLTDAYCSMGTVYAAQDNHSKALEYYKLALHIEEQVYSKEYASTANLYDYIGRTYYTLEDYPSAIKYMTQASVIWEKELGKESYDVAYAYSNIVMIYSFLKDYTAATEKAMEVLHIYKVLVQKDPQYKTDIVQTMGGLSYYTLFNKKFKEAEQYAKDALAMDTSQTWIKTNLIAACVFGGKYDEAERITKEIMNVKSEDGRIFREVILEDLDNFEKAGIITEYALKDVEKIREILNGK